MAHNECSDLENVIKGDISIGDVLFFHEEEDGDGVHNILRNINIPEEKEKSGTD